MLGLETEAQELVIGLATEQLHPFQHVAVGAHRGVGVKLGQDRRDIAARRYPQVVHQIGVVLPQGFGNGPPQAWYAADVQASQGTEQSDKLLIPRRLSQDMKAVFYLGVLELTQVSIDLQYEPPEVVRLGVYSQVPV